jgi:hypothetical protein
MDNTQLIENLSKMIKEAAQYSNGQISEIIVDWEERTVAGSTSSCNYGTLVPVIRIKYFKNDG